MTESRPRQTKVTVNFRPRPFAALTSATARENETHTEALNRAIVLYDMVTRTLADGGELQVQDKNGDHIRLMLY